MKNKKLYAALIAIPMLLSAGSAKAESYGVRMADNSDVVLVQKQIQHMKEMSETEIRLQLEMQAMQIENALNQAIASGEVVTEEQKETIHQTVDAIRTGFFLINGGRQ